MLLYLIIVLLVNGFMRDSRKKFCTNITQDKVILKKEKNIIEKGTVENRYNFKIRGQIQKRKNG